MRRWQIGDETRRDRTTPSGSSRVVIALGGNALLRRGESMDAGTQRRNVAEAAGVIALIARSHDVIVTHGNGPQVGLLALQAEAYRDVDPYPLDLLGAQTEGMIGFLIEEQLRPALPGREVVTLLTPVVVDREDPAFEEPTKPIGPVYPRAAVEALAQARGWRFAEDGDGFRRVVASPEPGRVIGIGAIRLLSRLGAVVICAGGGGVPVIEDAEGGLRGVEAVIDKDLTAAIIAREVEADALLLLTDVDAVYEDWGSERARPIAQVTPEELRAGDFPAGSMGPKVEAACRFVEGGGAFAGIGALADGRAILEGKAGTRVRR